MFDPHNSLKAATHRAETWVVGDMSLFGVYGEIGHVCVLFSRFNMCNRPLESFSLSSDKQWKRRRCRHTLSTHCLARNVTTVKCRFMSTLPFELGGMFPTSMTLMWWLSSDDATWGNYDLHDFYWSFWIITVETQQIILFYTQSDCLISCPIEKALHYVSDMKWVRSSSLISLALAVTHLVRLTFLLIFRLRLSSSKRKSTRADKASIFVSTSSFVWQQCLVMTACSRFGLERGPGISFLFLFFWTTTQISAACCFGDITSSANTTYGSSCNRVGVYFPFRLIESARLIARLHLPTQIWQSRPGVSPP